MLTSSIFVTLTDDLTATTGRPESCLTPTVTVNVVVQSDNSQSNAATDKYSILISLLIVFSIRGFPGA